MTSLGSARPAEIDRVRRLWGQYRDLRGAARHHRRAADRPDGCGHHRRPRCDRLGRDRRDVLCLPSAEGVQRMTAAPPMSPLEERVVRVEAEQLLLRAQTDRFVRLGPDIHVRRSAVVSVAWDRRHYMAGGSTATLIVILATGREFRIEHRPHLMDGADCYAIERELLNGAR